MTDHILDKNGKLIPDPNQSFVGNPINPPTHPSYGWKEDGTNANLIKQTNKDSDSH